MSAVVVSVPDRAPNRRKFMFADEAGDFAFARDGRASKYFMICTVTMDECTIGDRLLALRRDLAMDKHPLQDFFHASEDKQIIRDRVFDLLRPCQFTVDATILEKSKSQPKLRESEHRFYQYAWFYHLKKVAPRVLTRPVNLIDWEPEPAPGDTTMLVTTAALGTKKQRAFFNAALNDVAQQVGRRSQISSQFTLSAADPCLWVADYCTWAIQRKWERGCVRSYDLIKDKIATEFDLFRNGTSHYY